MITDFPPPPTHYETKISIPYKNRKKIKQQSYQMMNQLEGWCSNTKAMILMDLIFNHRPEVVVEIGVYGGKSLIPMAQALKANGKGIIYGIDPWLTSESVIGFNGPNAEWWGMLDHNNIMKGFLKKVNTYKLNNYIKVIHATSEAADPIYDIDLIHIDGNHSEDSALFDVKKWIPLVKPGGFIILDDLDWQTTANAVQWLDEHCYRLTTVHESNIWGLWLKL